MTVDESASGERLDRALAAALPDLTRSRVKALIESRRVALEDGRTIEEPSRKVKTGERFIVDIPEPEPAEPKPQAIDLDILYEDSDLLVLNKPAGLVVHPAPGNPDSTLVNALLAHCGDSLSGIGGVRRPGIVHRLDKDTSGVMVVAKNDRSHQALAKLFAAHDLTRIYQALVWGGPKAQKGTIEAAIGRHPVDRKRMAVRTRQRPGGRDRILGRAPLRAAAGARRQPAGRQAGDRPHPSGARASRPSRLPGGRRPGLWPEVSERQPTRLVENLRTAGASRGRPGVPPSAYGQGDELRHRIASRYQDVGG